MTNSQEYTLHVLNELVAASFASAEPQVSQEEYEYEIESRSLSTDRRMELAKRLKAEIAALHGQAADCNSIVAAAFAAMCTSVSDSAQGRRGDALQSRIDSALVDSRLPATLREGLARFSEGAPRHCATLT